MAFCGSCGTQVQDGVKFCPSCGTAIGSAPVQETQDIQVTPSYAPPVVPGTPTQSDIRDAQDNKVMAILSYVLFFIPLLTGAHKTSPFVKYHANQGTVLFLATVAWGIADGILTAIFGAILINSNNWYRTGNWGAYSAITTILGLIWFVPTALCVLGIVNAVGGKLKPLPVISKITIIK
jgi:uncharacterized membrane protein